MTIAWTEEGYRETLSIASSTLSKSSKLSTSHAELGWVSFNPQFDESCDEPWGYVIVLSVTIYSPSSKQVTNFVV